MSVSLYYMSVSAWGGKKRPSTDPAELELQAGRSHLIQVLKPDSGPLGESHELLTTEPSLHPWICVLFLTSPSHKSCTN